MQEEVRHCKMMANCLVCAVKESGLWDQSTAPTTAHSRRKAAVDSYLRIGLLFAQQSQIFR